MRSDHHRATQVTELKDGKIETFHVQPESFGLPRGSLSDLFVESPQASADAVGEIFEGELGPRRDHAVLNAAAALVVADVATDLADGVARANAAIDSGEAVKKLESLAEESNKP